MSQQIYRGIENKIYLTFSVGDQIIKPDQISLIRLVRGDDIIYNFETVNTDGGKYFVTWKPSYTEDLGLYTLEYSWVYSHQQFSNRESIIILPEIRGDWYLKIKNVLVRTFSLEFVDISWEVEYLGSFEPKFVVSKGLSESDVFVDISPELEDRYYFRDYDVEMRTLTRPYHYIVSVYDQNGNLLDITNPVTIAYEPDTIALAVADQFRRMLKRALGRKMLLLKKRRFGKRCECWDMELKKVTKSRCLSCFSTGWAGGYHRPMIVYGQLVEGIKAETISPYGQAEPRNAQFSISNYPIIHPDDLLVEEQGVIWRVHTVQPTMKRRTLIRQVANVTAVVPGDIEYEFPIKTSYFDTADEVVLNPKYDLDVRTL